jgi:hypothetical protein
VSAVAPSLVEILARQSRVLFTHITPTQPERATGRGFEERLDFRRGRTESRLGQAGAVGGPGSQLVVPLASAVGYSLTGQLRLDVGNCYELGFRSIDDFCSRFSTPTVSQPPLRTRSFPNLDLVAVATDSVGSLMGAGCRNEGDTMVYYGTYFSACRLRIPLTEFARAKTIDSVPYSWDISLPQYGKFLDNMTTSIYKTTSKLRAYSLFAKDLSVFPSKDEMRSFPRIEIRLRSPLTADANPTFVVSFNGMQHPSREWAWALVLPFAQRVQGLKGPLFAAGGGSANANLVDAVSMLSAKTQERLPHASTALGTARLAGLPERR